MPHVAEATQAAMMRTMGGRAVFGVLLGVAIVIAAIVLGKRFLPDPDEQMEWVRREDAVIVQMKNVGGLPQPEALDRATVPGFTLYGDGTLFFTQPSERGQFSSTPLRKATLTTDYMDRLLKFIEDQGFLNFSYEQPKLGAYYDFPTTYLYVSTKEAANAVSAYALDSAAPADKEWDQFRKLQEIKSRLDNIASAATDGAAPAYTPEAIVLFAERAAAASGTVAVEWPFADIDLARIAPESGVGERRIEGDQARAVLSSATPINGGFFTQGAQRFLVAYRPVLPYEENFPEFETTP